MAHKEATITLTTMATTGNTPFNINTASRAQLLTLPGIGPAIAEKILSERCLTFTDWDDVRARVKSIKKGVVAKIKRRHLAFVEPLPRFDPIQILPGDVAAICLSFVGVNSLLGASQRVSRAWRDAIDGGLPAIWHEVCLNAGWMTDARLAAVARMSRERMWSLKLSDIATSINLQALSQPSLRVLHIVFTQIAYLNASLSSFPLLEDVQVKHAREVVFSPLQHLKAVILYYCNAVKGFHNLPALTNLTLTGCIQLDADEPWPACSSIRELTIEVHGSFNPLLLDRIASLRHLTRLNTDWSFVKTVDNLLPKFFDPPYNQLAFLPTFSDLQHFTIELDYDTIGLFPRDVLFTNQCLGAMLHVRELCLRGGYFTDADMQCVAQLANLQCLKLINTYHITDAGIRLLASILPSLTALCLKWTFDISSFAFVSQCRELRTLTITSTDRRLTPADIQAIAQLQRLERLELYCSFRNIRDLSCFGALHSLRILTLIQGCGSYQLPSSFFAVLPTLSRLQDVEVRDIRSEDTSTIVACLVQMPQLRSICVGNCKGLTPQDEYRLRDALPYLEKLTFPL